MTPLWRKPPEHPRPDPDGARRQLEKVRQQRADVERLAAELREFTRRNHFAANLFALHARRKT